MLPLTQAFPGKSVGVGGEGCLCFKLNPVYDEVSGEPFIEILNPLQLWRKSTASLQECICKGNICHYLKVAVMMKSCPLYFFIWIVTVLVVSQGAYKLKYETLSLYIQDNTDTWGCGGFVCLTYRLFGHKNQELSSLLTVLCPVCYQGMYGFTVRWSSFLKMIFFF